MIPQEGIRGVASRALRQRPPAAAVYVARVRQIAPEVGWQLADLNA